MNLKHGNYMKYETWKKEMDLSGECPLCLDERRCRFCVDMLMDIADASRKANKEMW